MTERLPRIYLIGASGSGKTVAGRRLSNRLRLPFFDPAQAFLERDLPLPETYVKDPQLAAEVLGDYVDQVLADDVPAVVELPPSAVLEDRWADQLQAVKEGGADVIFLDAPIDNLAIRTGLTAAQMGLVGTPRAWFRALHSQLVERATRAAGTPLNTAAQTPDQTVDSILRLTGLS